MKDFTSFYDGKLLPVLKDLEVDRKKIISAIPKYALAAIAIVILLVGFFSSPFLGILAVGGIGYFFYKNHWSKIDELKARFKKQVIYAMVKYIDESLEYSPSSGIHSNEYHQSDLFKSRVDSYRCEDLVAGTIGKTSIRFSEVHTQRKEVSRDSDGKTQTRWVNIFRGIFFVADFNKHFNGRTVVLPDTAEKLFGSLGTMFQKMNAERDSLIKLEDPEFEKAFAVYGTDQVEARYILSTSLMQRIVEFRKKSGEIHLSFANSQIYMAIPVSTNLFEASPFKSFLDFKKLSTYHNYLALSAGIVEDLNLNTRIWTKE
jgi:hypothetical protein